jgi:hypothetical protein
MTLARPDLPARHPQNVPLNEWSDGWLTLSVCQHTDPSFMIANEQERRRRRWPTTRQEMIDLLIDKGDVPAAGTGLGARE